MDPKSYYELNRYYNEAEKIFDKIERVIKHWGEKPSPYDEGKFYNWEEEMDELIRVVTKGREE